MKYVLFSYIFLASVMSLAETPDDTINLTLKLPPEIATPQAFNNIALDQINRANSTVNTKMQKSDCPDCERLAHPTDSALSFTYGNGHSFAREPGQGGNQQWDFDLRLSKAIGDGCARIETGLLNEGHPNNHHRDGYYLQLGCSKKILKNLTLELAVGGYFSMDTTTRNGVELDEKSINILATAALKYYIGKSGLHLRLECDAVKSTSLLARGPDSLQCLAGIGKDFRVSANSLAGVDMSNLMISGGAVWTKTNHGGTNASKGESLELSMQNGNWLSRLGILATGDDGSINNRTGVAAEVDYMIPVGQKGRDFLYTGAGVYIARNSEAKRTEINPTLSFLGYQHNFGKNIFVRVDYSRIARPTHAPGAGKEGDSDMVRGQFGYRFK